MKRDEMLVAAKRLHDLGAAIHWLMPKSKRPVESKWTTGPRKAWDQLWFSYKTGYNIGVRTGEASFIGGRGYLACIDIDIKKPEFQKTAIAALKKLVGQKRGFPEVRSGAGNGSRHLYCLTKEPFKMLTIEKQEEWEICVYSTGRQMALPPSIHPESGRIYEWKTAGGEGPLTPDAFPFMEFEIPTDGEVKPKNMRSSKEAPTPFVFQEAPVDIGWIEISDSIRNGILQGTNVEDRSSYLLPACKALFQAGLSQNEILTLLTDKETYLGECAYEHAKTSNRARAAFWLYRYTLKKVIEENSAEHIFSKMAVIEEMKPLTEEELETQTSAMEAEIETPEDKGFYIIGKKGGRIPNYPALLAKFEEENPYKTIADMKSVFIFKDTHYVDYSPIEVKGFAEKNFNPKPDEKMRAEFYSKVLANNIDRRSFFTDSTEGKINFQNGVLDLNDYLNMDTVKSHSADYGFRGVLPYEFDPEAKCPVFLKWINSIMLGDQDLIKILQEFMGYIVRGGQYKYHKALWLGGVGRNGKSTFVDLLKALIGSGNFSTISIRSLVSDKFAGADLDGKIANFSEETSPQELADSGPFKNLTGDGEIYAQKKYGDGFSFRNRAKLVMTYNQIPDLKDLSTGMLSRPIIIPFKKVIKDEEQDRSIKEKLFAELPGIFNYAMKGWERLEDQNEFTKSAASENALKSVREESCNVFQWVENNVEFLNITNPNDPVGRMFTPQELYTAYSGRERYPFKAIEFYRRLNAHPRVLERKKKCEMGHRYFNLEMR